MFVGVYDDCVTNGTFPWCIFVCARISVMSWSSAGSCGGLDKSRSAKVQPRQTLRQQVLTQHDNTWLVEIAALLVLQPESCGFGVLNSEYSSGDITGGGEASPRGGE
jgi:hypothetical protein